MLAIRSCWLSAKLLTYLINLGDTLVIASGHITWGLPVLGDKSVVGCVAFPRSLLLSQILWSNHSARDGAVSCTKLKMSYVL